MKNKFLGVLFGAALVLGACGGGGDKANDNNAGGDTASVDAEKIVNNSCVSCHGNNLEGRGNAPAIDTIGATMSEDQIHDVIINGQGAMPPGLIKGDEATAVAKYLAEKK